VKIDRTATFIPHKNPNPVDIIAHSYFSREALWQSNVETTFREQGWLVYHTHRSERSEPGFPDLVMVLPGVSVVYAELKTEKGKLTNDQEKWLLAMAWTGETVFLWRPSDGSEIRDIISDCHALSGQFLRKLPERLMTSMRDKVRRLTNTVGRGNNAS
jgi:hypothetical protein